VDIDAGSAGWLTIQESDQGEWDAIPVKMTVENPGQVFYGESRHMLSPLPEHPGSYGGEIRGIIG
jgi:hypothetical protein